MENYDLFHSSAIPSQKAYIPNFSLHIELIYPEEDIE